MLKLALTLRENIFVLKYSMTLVLLDDYFMYGMRPLTFLWEESHTHCFDVNISGTKVGKQMHTHLKCNKKHCSSLVNQSKVGSRLGAVLL